MGRVGITSLGLALLMAGLCAGELIPKIGPLLAELRPLVAFFMYVGLGWSMGDAYSERSGTRRALLVSVALAGHLLLYSTPLIVGYYTFPARVAAAMAKSEGRRMSYGEATAIARAFLAKETGLYGPPAYAVYSMRQSLTPSNAGEHIAREFEDVDDLGGCIAALLNVVLYTIPIALKWLLVGKLHLVGEAGYIGLVFWYIVALSFSLFGLRMEMK